MDRKILLIVLIPIIMIILTSNFNSEAITENKMEGNLTITNGSNFSGFKASIIGLLDYNYNEYPLNEGIYQVQSDQPITLVILHYNASGYTSITPSSTTGETRGPMDVIGDLFVIIDGEVSRVVGFTSHENAFVLHLPVTQGKHFISIIYAGKDDTAGFVYSYDTILVDIQVDPIFSNWDLTFSHALVSTNEVGTANQIMDYQITTERNGAEYTPHRDFANGITLNLLEYSSLENRINIDMTINSTGSATYQVDNSFYATLGNVFLFDQLGIHSAVEFSQFTLFQNNANYGVLLFRDAGINSFNTTNETDWEGFARHEVNNLQSSFDFDVDQVFLDETNFVDYTPPVANTSTIGDTPTDTTPTDTTPTDTTPTDTTPTDTTPTDTTPTDTTPTDTTSKLIDPTTSNNVEQPTIDFLPFSNYWVLVIFGLVMFNIHRRKRT